MKKVLSTKTLDPNMLAYAQTLNLQVQCHNFIETVARPFDVAAISQDENLNALAFTSSNAVDYFFEKGQQATLLLQGKLIFALQGKTFERLADRGIAPDITAANADMLADAIIASKQAKGVIHICGSLKLPVLENKLKDAAIRYTDVVVYETHYTSKEIREPFDAVLFYSPSGVESFLQQNSIESKTLYCCIGTTTAQALRERTNNANIIEPVQPSPKFMLNAVADYMSKN